jgi:hypothetical protein
MAAIGGGLLVLLDFTLLAPVLVRTSVTPGQVRRAYFEPGPEAPELLLDEDQSGYISEIEVGAAGDLLVPSGRTIAVPLPMGTELSVQTLAADLAPYLVLGSENPVDDSDGVTRLGDALALRSDAGRITTGRWNSGRSWSDDRHWLRQLAADCQLTEQASATLRRTADGIAIRMGGCSGTAHVEPVSINVPLLVVVSGPYSAKVKRASGKWQQSHQVRWPLVGIALLRLLVLIAAVGIGPAVAGTATLLATSFSWHEASLLAWVLSTPLAVVALCVVLARRLWPLSSRAMWIAAGSSVLLQGLAFYLGMAELDVGSFGRPRIDLNGDSRCAVVGYSTVRGDALRAGSAGIVERLNQECAACRGNTSRFSREAQTLRWVREVVCSGSFPPATSGVTQFVGGGNDDVFYRGTRSSERLSGFLGFLKYAVQPVSATAWEEAFYQTSERILSTLDDQARDIEAIARCSTAAGRQLRFAHDFLIWDLERGRHPSRRTTLARRRQAVLAGGGEFIDLHEVFGKSAGVSWFNDFIHPSAAGHAEIARYLCESPPTLPPRAP